jgi:hypothetical protein
MRFLRWLNHIDHRHHNGGHENKKGERAYDNPPPLIALQTLDKRLRK